MDPIEPRQVLELPGTATAYCGKLLADLGADVVKLEPPGGDVGRRVPPFQHGESLPFLYLNTNKRSAIVDFDSTSGRDRFRELAAGADLILESFPPGTLEGFGLGYPDLSARNPALVLTSITGFGQTGPHRDFVSSDLIASALGGAMKVIGDPADPPVRLAGNQFEIAAATCAAASSMIALHHGQRTGRGQHVDISTQEVVASVSHVCGVGNWLEDGVIPQRYGTGLVATVPSGAYACRDGLVYLAVNRPAHWKALAQWIHETTGNQEVLDPMFDGPSSNRLPYRELIDVFVGDFTAKQSVDEVYHEGQRRRIAFTPANTAARIARDEHLEARDFFVDAGLRMPGAPYRHTETRWQVRRPAPTIGEQDEDVFPRPREHRVPEEPLRSGALGDLRVVEFGAGMAGPWIGRFMAWCGADVIKVESRAHPDVTRMFVSPRAPELGIQTQASPWFTDWNAGKRFVSLDLTKPEAAELARQIIDESDLVVANYSVGVLEKLGLGYADLAKRNPRLVMLTSNGFGDSGPQASYVTWGPNIEALSGLAALSGFPERDCTMTHFAFHDPLSALHGLFAAMVAIDQRDRGGSGQAIHLSQLETAIGAIGPLLMEFFATGKAPPKLGNASRQHAPCGCYPCEGDDRWCTISVSGDAAWQRFREVLGNPAWASDARFDETAGRLAHAEELDRNIGEWTSRQTDYDVMHTLQRAGIAAGVVQNVEDTYERDPQLRARGFFETIPHHTKGQVVASGIPLGLTDTPGHTPHAGEAIGQDNEAVFRELLGTSAAEYQRLIESGAIED